MYIIRLTEIWTAVPCLSRDPHLLDESLDGDREVESGNKALPVGVKPVTNTHLPPTRMIVPAARTADLNADVRIPPTQATEKKTPNLRFGSFHREQVLSLSSISNDVLRTCFVYNLGMSIESAAEKTTEESAENKAEQEKTALGVFRGKVWKALTLGSAALILQACAPSREEIDAIPTTAIEAIRTNGQALVERPVIKVKGFVEDLGKKGETRDFSFLLQETTTTHHYTLRVGLEKNSPSVGMVSMYEQDESGTSLADRIDQAIPPSFPSFKAEHDYELLVRVVPIKKGKETNYVVKIPYHGGGRVDLTETKAEKEK